MKAKDKKIISPMGQKQTQTQPGGQPAIPTHLSTPVLYPDITTQTPPSQPDLSITAQTKTVEPDPPYTPPPPPSQEETQNHVNGILFTSGLIFLGVIILTTVFASIFFFVTPSNKSQPEKKVSTIISTPQPSASAFDRSLFIFEVLNGSGVKGTAAKGAQQLEELGYAVESTGNADKSTYSGVTLFLTTEMSVHQADLLADLQKTFDTITYEGTFESDDETITAQIIVGK